MVRRGTGHIQYLFDTSTLNSAWFLEETSKLREIITLSFGYTKDAFAGDAIERIVKLLDKELILFEQME